MSSNNLSKESAGVQSYAPPVCYVIIMGTQRVICASGDDPIQGTEVVDEIEGIW